MSRLSTLAEAIRMSWSSKPAPLSARPKGRGLVIEPVEARLLLSATLPGMESAVELASAPAFVVTDKADYSPGETAVINTFNGLAEGSKFQVGEEVRFHVARTDGVQDYAMGNVPWFVTDGVGGFAAYQAFDAGGAAVDRDADGIADWIRPDTDGAADAAIGTGWFVEDQYLGSSLLLTAAGQASGTVALHEFTDSRAITSVTLNGGTVNLTVAPGAGITASVNVNTTSIGNANWFSTGWLISATAPGIGNPVTIVDHGNHNGPASFTETFSVAAPTAAGTYNAYFIAYQNDSGNAGASPVFTFAGTVTVAAPVAATTTTVSSSANASTYGNAVTFTANVASTATPTGAVNFVIDGTTFAGTLGASTSTASTWTYTTTATQLNAGTHTVSANYLHTGAFADSTGLLTGGQVVAKANATVTVAGYSGTYDASAHGATGTATGVGGVNLIAGLSLGDSFTNAPGGTALWSFAGGTNYNNASGTASISIAQADAAVSITAFNGTFDAVEHNLTGTFVGVGGDAAAAGASLTFGAGFINASGGTGTWAFEGGVNYLDESGTAAIVIAKASAVVNVSGFTGVYDAAAHGATGTVTGVTGDSAAVGSSLALGASFTNAPGGTANWTFTGGMNYANQSGTAAIVINKATAGIVVTPYNLPYDTTEHTATATATGVDAGGSAAGTSFNLTGTRHTIAGTYTDSWSFNGGTNYVSTSGVITDVIGARSATVNYIGQQTFTTSGTSATTAQVTLTASMQDATGLALAGATVDFIDSADGKVLAAGVKVSAVAGSPGTGTANTVVTLSTGQYGSQEYIILVKLTGNYDNSLQAGADKTATVVVSKPAATNQIIGGGTIANLATKAGAFGVTAQGTTTYSVGLQYNKAGTSLQGKVSLVIEQDDGSTIYVKSNSITSMTVTNVTGGKQTTVYTKASVYRIDSLGVTTTIDGGVTLRLDAIDLAGTANDKIGFTVLSTKTSEMYYANDWFYDAATMTWKNRAQAAAGGITIG